MKRKLQVVSVLLILTIFAAACAAQPTSIPDVVETTGAELSPTVAVIVTEAVDDLDSLLSALRQAGATVEPGEDVEQPFFTVTGQTLKVNGGDVQVFVYDTAEAMEAEAAQVAEDGGSIGTNMVNWVESPHFYKLGRMIVLYVGEDQGVQDLLEGVFGPQFAGR
jgi:hypothetical protein